jgi:hypothetical protein
VEYPQEPDVATSRANGDLVVGGELESLRPRPEQEYRTGPSQDQGSLEEGRSPQKKLGSSGWIPYGENSQPKFKSWI